VAVAVGTPTTGAINNGAASTTFSVTVAGSPPALYVRAAFWNGGGTQTLNTVTFNSVGLTRVAQSALSNGQDRAEIWRLLSPANATANVVATFSASSMSGALTAATTTGQDTSTPEGTAAASASTVNGTASGNVAVSAATGDLILCGAVNGGGTAMTPGATGGTPTEEYDAASGGEQYEGFWVDGAATAVAISGFTSAGWALAAIPLKQTAGGAAAQRDPVLYRVFRAF
jgi:hypothetical protein